MSATTRNYPEPTDQEMAILEHLLDKRGVKLKVADTGALMIRDRAHNLTPDDRAVVEHYRVPLAEWLRRPPLPAPDLDETARPKRDHATEATDGAARCRRCGSSRYLDVPVHDGASIRRDCAACRLTVGFPLWRGVAAEVTT